VALTFVGPVGGLVSGQPGGVSAAYDITAAAVLTGPGAQTITAITQAANAIVTISTGGAANPFFVGETVSFTGIVGMTQLNGTSATVVAIGGVTTAWTITLNVNSTAFTAYASAGTIYNVNPSILCQVACQVAGTITLNDSNTLAAAGLTNQIITIASMTAGQVLALNWPCALGITASVVTTGTFSVSFT
jgi:Ubiquitin-activating enzyme E1 FCCH domain